MSNELADALERLVREAEGMLRKTPEIAAAEQLAPGKWSSKQILGHLIDSAANNHRRFVLAQLENGFQGPGYDADGWVSVQGYAAAPWNDLITLWANYNLHLARVVRAIDPVALRAVCRVSGVSGGEPVTLRDLIADYIEHMNHHLQQIRNG